MSTPDPTGYVATCLRCDSWQVDAPPRARASLGVDGVLWALAEAANAHQFTEHADVAAQPLAYRGAPLTLDSGRPANGGLVMHPFPRWWDWISVKGAR